MAAGGFNLFPQIEALENQGLIDGYFRECYELKQSSGPDFFHRLLETFLSDIRTIIRDITNYLNEDDVNFTSLQQRCFKLKGSSGCIGAVQLSTACNALRQAIDNKNKEDCLAALDGIKQQFAALEPPLMAMIEAEQGNMD